MHKANIGNSAEWSELGGVSTPVSGDVLKYKRLAVEVWDKNSSSDQLLATGDAALRKLGASVGKEVSLVTRVRDAKGLKAGTVEVVAVVDENEVLDISGLDGSMSGYFEIVKIATVNLRNTGNVVSL